MNTSDATDGADANQETVTEIVESWNDSQETLLKAIAERSNCMRWLHNECNLYFEKLNFIFTIPNVVISTVNGSITMSLQTLFPDISTQKTATTVIGLVSIFSAVLITLNQYVKSQQMTEAHRSAALSYSKLHRTIMNELAMRRDQRMNGLECLRHVREELDRLENVSPAILPSVVVKFNKQFGDKQIEKPEVTGDLDEVFINKEGRPTTNSSDSDTTNPLLVKDEFDTNTSTSHITSSVAKKVLQSLPKKVSSPSFLTPLLERASQFIGFTSSQEKPVILVKEDPPVETTLETTLEAVPEPETPPAAYAVATVESLPPTPANSDTNQASDTTQAQGDTLDLDSIILDMGVTHTQDGKNSVNNSDE